jgi:DNA-binding transcriptional LysR family regulator
VNDEWPLEHGGITTTIHPRSRFTADNGAALVPAVIAGLGIAMLPNFLISDLVARGELVVVMPDYPMPEAGVYVVRPSGGSAPCKVRVLIDIMVEKFGGVKCTEPE